MKQIPRVLLVGLALAAVDVLWWIAIDVSHLSSLFSPRWELTMDGLRVASQLTIAVGLVGLARGLTGRRATAARVAVGGAFTGVVMLAWWRVSQVVQLDTGLDVLAYVWWAAACAAVVGLAGAAGRARARITIPLVVIALVIDPPPPLRGVLHLGLGDGISMLRALAVARLMGKVALIALACRDHHEVPEPARAAAGLERAARALWLRVIAAVAVTGLAVLAMTGRGDSAVTAFKFATIAGVLVNVIALVQFGIGALGAAGSAAPGVRATPLILGGVGSLWAAGALLLQGAQMYRFLYGQLDDRMMLGGDARDYVEAFAIVIPAIAAIAIGAVGSASTYFASEMTGNLAGFGVMIAISIGVQTLLLPHSESLGSVVMLSLLVAGLGMWAWILMARLLAAAAAALRATEVLPVARVEHPVKQVPRLVTVGLCLAIAFGLIQIARALLATDDLDSGVPPGWLLAENGVNIAIAVTTALGLAELADRLTGRAAVGVRIAMFALCAQVVVELAWIALGYVEPVYGEQLPVALIRVVLCASWGLGLAIALGLGLAASRWLLGIVVLAVAAATNPPWFLHVLWGWNSWSFREQQLIQFSPRVVLGVVLLVAVAAASARTIVVTDAAPVPPGLRRAGFALWARALAAAVVAVGHIAGDPWVEMVPALQLAATAVDTLALMWFAAGLIRAVRGSVIELPKWPLAVAVAATLWLLGVELAQLPWRYYLMEGPRGELGAPGALAGYATALALPGLVVSGIAITCTLGAIAVLAARRSLVPLGTQARITVIGFVVLTASAALIQRWLAFANAPVGEASALAANGAAIVALGLAAWLCGRAASSIDQEAPRG